MADTRNLKLYGSATEVERITGVNRQQVPGLAARGLLGAIQIPGHRVKYSLVDARRLVDACSTAPPTLSTVARSRA